MPRPKSLIRSITEAIDAREIAADEPVPPVDAIGVHTAGTTITTDIPDFSSLDDPELVSLPHVPVTEPESEEEPEPEEEPKKEPEAEPEKEPEEEPVAEAEDWETEFKRRERFRTKPSDVPFGGMSKPGKMPCITFSMLAGGAHPEYVGRKGIDPETLGVRGTCPKGTKLARVPGSVCYGCYAYGGNYLRANVINAMARRSKATRDAIKSPAKLDRWIDAIVSAIGRAGNEVFRWHDSGDILGPKHLEAIVEVARRQPRVRFWLPTKEHGTVSGWMSTYGVGALPRNLNIRLSTHMLFDVTRVPPPLTSSSVASGKGYKCPATYYEDYQEKYTFGSGSRKSPTCGPCRECWSRKTRNVDYAFHGAQYQYRHGLLTHGLIEPGEKKGEFVPPEKPRLWTPQVPAVAKAFPLPKRPGPVKRIIRPEGV